MSALSQFLARHGRKLLLFAAAGVTFGLWLGIWMHVATVPPRTAIHCEGFAPLCFAEDSRSLYGLRQEQKAGTKPEFKRWDVESGQSIDLEAAPEDLMFVVSGDGRQMFNLRNHPRLASSVRLLSANGSSISFQHAADRMVLRHQAAGSSNTGITLWDLSTDQELPIRSSRSLAALSADGSRLATAPSTGTTIQVWNARDGSHLAEIDPGPQADPRFMRLSPDGKRLAIPVGTREVHVWTLNPPKRVAELEGYGLPSFSSDWTYRIAGGQEATDSPYIVKVLELDSGKQVAELMPYPPMNRPRIFAGPVFVSKSNWLLIYYGRQFWWQSLLGRQATSDEGHVAVVRLFHPGTWKEAPKIEQANGFLSAWSPDGTMLAMAVPSQNKVLIYDLPPRRPVFLLLALSALPTLLFTALLWWRFGR